MYRVQAKSVNAFQSWSTCSSHPNETSALSNAMRLAERFLLVRVIDAKQNVVWSGGSGGCSRR